jgi:hypothetical protein
MEAMLASSLLAASVLAVTMPFNAGAQNEQADARMSLACALGQEMMEEILAHEFWDANGVNPGPETGQTRATFDSLDDYHGYAESEGSIQNVRSQVCTEAAAVGLSRSVAATYVYVAGQDTSRPPTCIRLDVSIMHKGQLVLKLSRLVCARQ